MRPADAKKALCSRARALVGLSLIGEMEKGSGLVLDEELLGKRSEVWRPSRGGWRHGS
jgi:hypothetical protein